MSVQAWHGDGAQLVFGGTNEPCKLIPKILKPLAFLCSQVPAPMVHTLFRACRKEYDQPPWLFDITQGLLSLTLCLSPCSHLPLPSEKFHKDPTNGECSMTFKASRASEPGSGMVGSSPGGLRQAYKLPEIRALHPSQEAVITEFVQSKMTS